ncbi:hypothetical protein ABZT23_28070 [Streptomyces sp. NPDC005386]|uniref:hypothetical protein n=1 Tax=Streptomyces sp. NPDC005386 TaxID=3154562 RepID=UPI0033B04353
MSNETVWWPVSHIARYIVGIHPQWLYIELENNRRTWGPFLHPDGKRLLLNADAVADYLADNPDALNYPLTRPAWKKRGNRGGKGRRK